MCAKILLSMLIVQFQVQSVAGQYTRTDEYSGNPLFDHLYTADASALVHNDTLYLFTGHDKAPVGGSNFVMNNWHVFSTADMINWTDHGPVLGWRDFSWASCCAFAGHCTEKDGKFYWYVPMINPSLRVNEGFAIGVAVADHPAGPYEATDHILVSDHTPNSIDLNIDPCVYVDDDGQIYFYWGSWGALRYAKLKDNMVELDGPVHTVNTTGFFEAPYIHKNNDTYYLSYSSGYPSSISYATGNSVTGPWHYQGEIAGTLPNSETNHQAIVEFKNQWFFVYHNGANQGGGTYRRSVCIDNLEYNGDGTIKPVNRTTRGVRGIAAIVEDCAGVTGGKAYIDECGECVGGNTGQERCEQDCNGDWGGQAYSDDCGVCVGGQSKAQPCAGSVQGEDAAEFSGVSENTNEGYIGEGYLNFTNEIGASARWDLSAEEPVVAEIAIRYANGSETSRAVSVSVNGEVQLASLDMPLTGSWTTWRSAVVTLEFQKGANQITLSSLTDQGGPNVDVISYSSSLLSELFTSAKVATLNAKNKISLELVNHRVSFHVKEPVDVELSLFMVSGKKVQTLFKGKAKKGRNTCALPVQRAPGLYIIQLNSGSGVKKTTAFLSQ